MRRAAYVLLGALAGAAALLVTAWWWDRRHGQDIAWTWDGGRVRLWR